MLQIICDEPYVLAEPNRNLVQHPGKASDQAWKLCIGQGSAREDLGFHRVFQQDAGQAVQVDVHGTATQRVNRLNVNLGKIQPLVDNQFCQGVLDVLPIDRNREKMIC
jgi:hypothetical protein